MYPYPYFYPPLPIGYMPPPPVQEKKESDW